MRYLTYGYLLRVPLLTAAALPLLTFLALQRGSLAYPLLHGLFDLTALSLGIVTGQIVLLVTTLAVVTDIVIQYGPKRFGVPASRKATIILGAGYVLAGAYVATKSALASVEPLHLKLVALLLGVAAAVTLIVLGWILWEAPARLLRKLFRSLPPWVGRGYLNDKGELASGHVFAGFCLVLLLAITLLFATRVLPLAATLTSLLTVVLLAAFLFAGMAYFFDYFRLPYQLALLAILSGTAWVTRSDQYFVARRVESLQPVRARDVLEKSKHDTAIIVCAQGGGIQAAAWAARVLTGLDLELKGEFAPRVRLISSVSGGAVGAFYFVSQYKQGKVSDHEKILASSVASSLDEIAFGLVYRDLVRVFLPWAVPKHEGRGQMSEDAWSAQPSAPDPNLALSGWRKDVLDGSRPATIFNATIAETGQRFLMSTVDLGRELGRRELYELYPGYDVRPVVAARLSSAFPVVSPAARIDAELASAVHLVDGGYHDNYGVVSAIDFLLEATHGTSPVPRILILEILGQAVGIGDAPPVAVPLRGWAYQAAAPFQAFYETRSSTQVSRNRADLDRVMQILKARNVKQVDRIAFPYPSRDAPFSWHLTRKEISDIEASWSGMRKEIDQVAKFLGLQ